MTIVVHKWSTAMLNEKDNSVRRSTIILLHKNYFAHQIHRPRSFYTTDQSRCCPMKILVHNKNRPRSFCTKCESRCGPISAIMYNGFTYCDPLAWSTVMLPDIKYCLDRMTTLLLDNDHFQNRSTAIVFESDCLCDISVVMALDNYDTDTTRTTECLSNETVCVADRSLWHWMMMTIHTSSIVISSYRTSGSTDNVPSTSQKKPRESP